MKSFHAKTLSAAELSYHIAKGGGLILSFLFDSFFYFAPSLSFFLSCFWFNSSLHQLWKSYCLTDLVWSWDKPTHSVNQSKTDRANSCCWVVIWASFFSFPGDWMRSQRLCEIGAGTKWWVWGKNGNGRAVTHLYFVACKKLIWLFAFPEIIPALSG